MTVTLATEHHDFDETLLLFSAVSPLMMAHSGCTPAIAPTMERKTAASVAKPPERTVPAAAAPEAMIVLLKPRGANLRRLMDKYDGDEDLPTPGVTIDVPPQDTPSVVHTLQKQVGRDYLLFVSERGFVFGKPDSISVLKVADPFDALRVVGTVTEPGPRCCCDAAPILNCVIFVVERRLRSRSRLRTVPSSRYGTAGL